MNGLDVRRPGKRSEARGDGKAWVLGKPEDFRSSCLGGMGRLGVGELETVGFPG